MPIRIKKNQRIRNCTHLNNTHYFSFYKQVERGFSLLEVAVVVAILGILSALAFPNIARWVALAKIDAVKTLLNSAASECLQEIREGSSPEDTLVKDSVVSNDALGSHGYKIKDNDKTCASYFVIPINEKEDFMYELGFKINSLGEIAKIAVPASDSGSLNSCKNWAGVNCGVSAEQQAVWDALAKIEKDKKTCNDDFYAWLQKPSSGSYNRWDEATKSCSLETWAFEGSIQKDEAAVKSARAAKIGAACTAKLKEKETAKFDGIFTDAECPTTYFCTGKDLATDSATAYNACKEEERENLCKSQLSIWRASGGDGQFPGNGCTAIWKCKQTYYTTKIDYDQSECGCKIEQERYLIETRIENQIIGYDEYADPSCGCESRNNEGRCIKFKSCRHAITKQVETPIYGTRDVCRR